MERTPSLAELSSRADRMRRWALTAPAPLATAYRRRACELELLLAITAPEAIGHAA